MCWFIYVLFFFIVYAANWVVGYAQTHIKLESYGFAITDATKAIELDASYVKVRDT